MIEIVENGGEKSKKFGMRGKLQMELWKED